MKKLLILAGALIALPALFIGVVLIVGANQPVEHVASSRASFARPPAEVFARLADFERWPEWSSAFDKVVREADSGDKPRWRFEGGMGAMPMVIDEAVAPTLLVARIPADAELGYAGTWTYALAPTGGGGTLLTITEDAAVDSLLFRGIGALFMNPHGTMNGVLVDVGRSFGEEVEPEELAP